eukprot:jgi/Bigna1/127093/aug1.3_g1801
MSSGQQLRDRMKSILGLVLDQEGAFFQTTEEEALRRHAYHSATSLAQKTSSVILFSLINRIATLEEHFVRKISQNLGLIDMGRKKYRSERGVLRIAGLFIQHAPLFGLYSRYALLLPEVSILLKLAREDNEEFSDFLKECEQRASGDQGKPRRISNWLLAQLKDLSKYTEYLADIVKDDSVDDEGEAFAAIERAQQMLRRSSLDIKESQEVYENEKRVNEIQDRYRGSVIKVSKPGRVLHLKVKATKISKHNNKKEYTFLLFNDTLMYASEKKIHADYLLCNIGSEDLPEDTKLGICTRDKAFIVEFSCKKTRDEWRRTLNALVRQNRLLRTGTTEPISGLYKVWDQTKTCSVCKKRVGYIFSRLFHCHECGRVVCAKCSMHRVERWRLRGGSSFPNSARFSGTSNEQEGQRVCDVCMKEIKAAEENGDKRDVTVSQLEEFQIYSPKSSIKLRNMWTINKDQSSNVNVNSSTGQGMDTDAEKG